MGFPKEIAKWALSKHPTGAKVAVAAVVLGGGYAAINTAAGAIESHRQYDERLAAAGLIDRGCAVLLSWGLTLRSVMILRLKMKRLLIKRAIVLERLKILLLSACRCPPQSVRTG